MNRLPLPLLSTVLAVALLSASCAYWALQFYQPPQRPLAAPPPAAPVEPPVDAAALLFGGRQAAVAAPSNYQLMGVVAGGADSVAIIVADGKPAKAVKIGREIVPGVTVQEVKPRYVMLSEGGVPKRVDLPEPKPGASVAPAAAPSEPAVAQPVPAQPSAPAPAPEVSPPPPTLQMPTPVRGVGGPVEPPKQ
ncbi:MAG: type II secretion system protein N [Telluria sp.]